MTKQVQEISDRLSSMKTLANMLLDEAAKSEKLLEKMTKPKSVEEMEIEKSLLQRKIRIIKSCNK